MRSSQLTRPLSLPHRPKGVLTPRTRLGVLATVGDVLIAAALGLTGAALAGCELATPFTGDGYRSGTGVTLPSAGDEVAVGVTHAVLDGNRREAFDEATRNVIASLPGLDGYIGHSVRARVLGNEVWTMTVWRDAEALDAFVRSPAHRAAMASGLPAVKRAQFMRLTWPTATAPPSWDEILVRLLDVRFVEYRSPVSSPDERP